VKKALVCIVFAIILCSTFVVLTAATQGAALPVSQSSVDWWPTFRHDASHSGYTTSSGPTSNSILWNVSVGSGIESSPSVVNGYVYVPTVGGIVYCLNATTGAQIWNYTTGGYVFTPSISNNCAYVSSYDHHVYCLNATTGAQIWNFTTGANAYPPTVSDGYVYMGAGDGDNNLYCLNATTGTKVWSYEANAGVTGAPAVANGYVYIGSNDDNVYCINAQTGTLVWNYTTGSYVYSSPTVANGNVYVGSQDHNVYCLNAQTGAKIWSYTTGYSVFSAPAVVNGNVYVGSEDYHVYCLNAQTGALEWKYATGNYIISSPAVSSNGNVYIGSYDANIYCINAQKGTLVWEYSTGGYVYSSPAIANGILYVGSSDDQIYAFGSLSSSQPSTNASSNSSNSSPQSAWVPVPTDALAAVGVAAVITGAVSFAFSAISNPLGGLGGKVGDKTKGSIPDRLKSWLEEFISSKREVHINAKTGSPYLPTKPETLAYVVAIFFLALAFSYVQASSFTQIVDILPLILVTSVLVALVKKFFTISYMRSRGVWSEHKIWPLGLVLFIVTTFAFKVPFSSPTRNVKISPESGSGEKDPALPSAAPKVHSMHKHIKRLEAIASASEILIGVGFAAVFFIVLKAGFTLIGSTGLAMCIIGAFFDTLPIAPMSGKDIYDHSKKLWIGLFVGTLALYTVWILLL